MENTKVSKDIILEHIDVSGVLYITVDNDLICTHKFSEHIKIKIVFNDSVEERKVKEQDPPKDLQNVQDRVISIEDGDLSAEEHSLSDSSLNFSVRSDKSKNNETTKSVTSMTPENKKKKKIQNQQTIKLTKIESTSLSSTSKIITSSRNLKKEIFAAKRSHLYKQRKDDLSELQKPTSKSGKGRKKYSKKLEKEKDVYCPYCCKWFKSQQEFFDHRKAEKKNYSCGKCHKILHYKAHLMVHNIRKHTKLELQDAESVDSGGDSFKKSNHSSSDVTHVQNNLKCEICGMLMCNLSSLKTHIMRHTGESAYRCCVCGEQMHSISRYSKHVASHSSTGQVKCTICNFTFENRSELSRHKLTHTYPCSLCGQSFPNKTGRYFHYKTFHKNDILKCPKCCKLFSSKKELDSHLKYHRNRNKTQCTVCGLFVFRLSMHMLSHASKSEDVNIPVFVCDKCPKQFKQKLSLQRHLTTHSEEKPYSCTECSKQFARSGGLRRHMMTHMPEKPFVCEVCGKSCSQLGNLKIHMQTHKESKVLNCTHCGTGFKQKDALQEHMNTVHLLERNIFTPSEQYFQPNTMYHNMYY